MQKIKILIKNRCDIKNIYQFSLCAFFVVALNATFSNLQIMWWGAFGLVFVSFLIYISKNEIKLNKYIIWNIAFTFISMLSSLWALNVDYSIEIVKGMMVRNVLMWFISLLISREEDWFSVVKTFIFSSFINLIYILNFIDISTIGSIRIGANSVGKEWNANSIGMLMAFAAFASYFMYKNQKKNRIVYLIYVALFSFVAIFSGSKKALFILIFTFVLYNFIFSKNKLKTIVISTVLCIVLLWLMINVPSLYKIIGKRIGEFLNNFFGNGNTDHSTIVRVSMMKYGFWWFKEKAILGYGINNYRVLYGIFEGVYTYGHNNYIELLVGIGIIGTAVYYLAYVYIIKNTVFKERPPLIFAFVMMLTTLIIEVGLVSYSSFFIQFLICLSFSAIKIYRSEEEIMNNLLNLIKNPKRVILGLANRGLLNWISDEVIIKIQFMNRMNKKLDTKNPQTFNEKLQWLKLYDRNALYTDLVDKFEVRKHISKIIGEEYLIPLIGVWDKFDEIDFCELPDKFVLKCTHDSGSVAICYDKCKFNIQEAKEKINKALKRNYFYKFREWPYKNVKPRIMCEKFISDKNTTPDDYKVLCFNGKAKLVEVHVDRFGAHKQDFYDINWRKTSISQGGTLSNFTYKKPKQFETMIELSERLSEGICHVRIDWFVVNDKLYFGEMTFYDGAGLEPFDNIKDDYLLGSWIKLPIEKIEC